MIDHLAQQSGNYHRRNQHTLRGDRQKQCAFKGILIAQELVSGLVYAIEDISSWHKDRGIKSMGNVYSVLNGSRKSSYGHKFWRLETCPEEILGQVRM